MYVCPLLFFFLLGLFYYIVHDRCQRRGDITPILPIFMLNKERATTKREGGRSLQRIDHFLMYS